jgi:hypothetical protein
MPINNAPASDNRDVLKEIAHRAMASRGLEPDFTPQATAQLNGITKPAAESPANIGTLTFTAAANNRYSFVSYVTLVPDGSMTISPTVNFASGTCNFTTETQTTATSAFATATKTTSDDVATTYASTGTTARTLRISGTFFNTVDTAVTLRLQNSTGTITAKTGSYLTFTKVA